MKKRNRVLKEINSLKPRFSRKIRPIEDIKKIIGERPRRKRVVMCHGTFDIVHPGHIRQLIYARSKGDILIVLLTADQYINKGKLRPYVTQELRAINLAAFEIVDYVVIDHNPTPVENILKLKPDFFVKGFEYSKSETHPRTVEEIEALSSYGGKMVYSPGDIVYSSTKLLSIHKPNLAIEQLLILMSEEGVTFADLRKTIAKFKKTKIHVVGDIIIDKYSRCSILGPAQKSPAFSVRLEDQDLYLGGAGIVAKHLKSLGSEVTFTTILGKDDQANFAIKDLKKAGIKTNALVDPAKPTTTKERFYADGRLLLQVDVVDNHSVSDEILTKICKMVIKNQVDAVVCSDFRHGIFNSETIPAISTVIPKKTLKIADSQVSNRWGNILDFPNFDLITPNEREARFALADQDTTIRPLAQILYNSAQCKYLVLKLGADGIMTYRSPGMESREYFYIDSLVEELIDPIGAGDALLATTTLGLIASENIVQASILGNMSAALECSRLGNIPITTKELLEMTYLLEKSS